MKTNRFAKWLLPVALPALLLIGACDDDNATTSTTTTADVSTPTLDMGLPTALTGAESTTSSLSNALATVTGVDISDTRSAHGAPHCFFEGAGSGQDPFQNGYVMTRFLVGAVAQWMCITDFLIVQIAALPIPTDGSIQTIPPDANDPGAPSGISITTDSATQKTIRLFFNSNNTSAGVYLSWNTNGGSTQGKLVLADGFINDASNPDPGAPNAMRMDFSITGAAQVADMYLTFPSNHPNVNGFRIQVTKKLDTTDFSTFTALGRIDMSVQFDTAYVAGDSGATIPSLLMYTVSDVNGNGAAIASFANVGISLDVSTFLLGHLGHYLFTKDDKYVFNSALQAEWIEKNVTVATFQDSGARTSDANNLNNIETFLGLPGTYFDTNSTCGDTGDDCSLMLNNMFSGGNYGQEGNFGSDPGDQRTDIINNVGSADYLQTVCADGAVAPCPSTMFDHNFTPTN